MIHLELARAFHHVERADEIGVGVGARVLKTVSHTGLPCEMDDDIGLLRHRQLVQFVEIFEHPDMCREMPVLQQHLVPLFFQAHIVVVGHAVVADDGKTLVKEKLRQVKADKAGRTGYEDLFLHLLSPWVPVIAR